MLLLLAGVLLCLLGLAGCVLPVLPGPPLNWAALLLLHFFGGPYSTGFLVVWGAVALVVTALDFVLPGWGAKWTGGSKLAVTGSVVGMLVGCIWFPPFGMLLGAFAGAIAGELVAGKSLFGSLKAGGGVFLGTTFGIIVKLAAAGAMTYYFVVGAV